MACKERKKAPLNEEQRKLIEDNYGLINYFLQFYDYDINEYDDIMGYCHLYICDAARLYDPSKGKKYSTYVGKTIRSAIYNYRRDKARSYGKELLTLDAPGYNHKGEEDEEFSDKNTIPYIDKYSENYPEKVYFWEVYNQVLSSFPKNKQIIIEKYFLGERTYEEVGKLTGLTHQRVNQIINDFRNKFKALYKERGEIKCKKY